MAEFKFNCPQCGQIVEADETFRGQSAECPYCGKGVLIPTNSNVQMGILRKGNNHSQMLNKIRMVTSKTVALWKSGTKGKAIISVAALLLLVFSIVLPLNAARNGKAEEQFELAKKYYQGEGVSQDESKAALWCRKAAENGHV